jgi:photosystem II stability/assembly factor-like uncharacterized protein
MSVQLSRRTMVRILGSTVAAHHSAWGHDLRPGDPSYRFQDYEAIVNRNSLVKQVYEWPNVANTLLFANIRNGLNGFQFSYDIPPDELQIVVQAYSLANAATYDDFVWDKYRMGEALAVRDPPNEPASHTQPVIRYVGPTHDINPGPATGGTKSPVLRRHEHGRSTTPPCSVSRLPPVNPCSGQCGQHEWSEPRPKKRRRNRRRIPTALSARRDRNPRRGWGTCSLAEQGVSTCSESLASGCSNWKLRLHSKAERSGWTSLLRTQVRLIRRAGKLGAPTLAITERNVDGQHQRGLVVDKQQGERVNTIITGMLLSPFLLMSQQNSGAWSNIGPSPAAVQAIAIDPRGTGTILMGTIGGGVRKSVDGGITWSAANTGLTNLEITALAMDASGPQTAYAGGSGLSRTTDGGATWQNLPAISGSVASVAADPNRPGVVYAAVFSNLANGSITKSIDGGLTWATLFPTTAAIFNIAINPRNSDVLYAATIGHGAFKSTDGGQRWSAMSALTPAAIWTIALDSANDQVLYAGTNEDGIWKSADAGDTWDYVGSPGPFPAYSLVVDRSAAHTIYVGTNGGGVWRSSDSGITWQSTGLSNGLVSSLAVSSEDALYGGTNAAGAQVSWDRGATWTILPADIEAANKHGYGIWIDPNNGQKMFVSSEEGYGMVWSQDGGVSWATAGQGFTAIGSRSVAFDPSDTQRIYAGGMVGNVFLKSTDGGLTWSTRRFGTAAAYVISVAVDPLSPNTIYVGTQNEGVFRSTDYGNTWKSTASRPAGAITFLTPDPGRSGRLFASTATAFHLSEDSGETWTNVLNVPAWTVTIDPDKPSRVYTTAPNTRHLPQRRLRTYVAGHQQRPDKSQHGPKRPGDYRFDKSPDAVRGEQQRRFQEPRRR